MNTPYGMTYMGKTNEGYNYQDYETELPQERPTLKSLIGVGDCIYDILTEVNKDFIMKYNLDSNNKLFYQQNDKIFDEIERRPFVRYVPGGSIQNTLRVLSCRLNIENHRNNFLSSNNNINRKNYKISMLGSVGDDKYSYKIYNSLVDCMVEPILKSVQNMKTSRCGICMNNKKAYTITEINASKHLDEEFISQNLDDKILNHDCLLIGGHFLKYHFEICKKLCEAFYNDQKKIILTLSDINFTEQDRLNFVEIGKYADIIYGNIQKAEELVELKGADISKIIIKICQMLIEKDRTIVLTHDKEGAYGCIFDYKRNNIDYILQCFPQKIKPEEIVDEIGAGDSFLGGFLAEYMKGSSLNDCLKIGNETANVILHNCACTFPKNFEVKKYNPNH